METLEVQKISGQSKSLELNLVRLFADPQSRDGTDYKRRDQDDAESTIPKTGCKSADGWGARWGVAIAMVGSTTGPFRDADPLEVRSIRREG